MAIKDLLLVIFIAGIILGSTAEAETLEGRSECNYEVQTEKFSDGKLRTYQKERCVEEPGQTVRQVLIGQLVRETWVNRHPVVTQYFDYRGNRCRWFLESGAAQKDLVQYQGIICEVQPNAWRVIDKF